MATERQAKQVVAQHASQLAELGAHSIGTASGKTFGMTGYVVVATIAPGASGKLPNAIAYDDGDKRTTVPVVTREMEQFRPEKL